MSKVTQEKDCNKFDDFPEFASFRRKQRCNPKTRHRLVESKNIIIILNVYLLSNTQTFVVSTNEISW